MVSKSQNRSGLYCRHVSKAEASILLSSRNGADEIVLPKSLRSFFVRYAHQHLRALPWRTSRVKPFHLLLAEVLLIQTKAEDVARIWPQLVKKYRNPRMLVAARRETLVTLLKPLGLQNQRAQSLKRISGTLLERFNDKVPSTVQELLSIPHVGLYAATAVSCFGFGQRVPIVDANVLRVLGRIRGTQVGKDLRRTPDVWAAAWAILPKANASLHNYGLLDFASAICRIRKPLCESCPLRTDCIYGQKRTTTGDSCADSSSGHQTSPLDE